MSFLSAPCFVGQSGAGPGRWSRLFLLLLLRLLLLLMQTPRLFGYELRFEYKEKTNTIVQKGILVLAYISYLLLGAMIFRVLEKDFEVQQRQLAVNMKVDFLKKRSNMTQEDVEQFLQAMTSIIRLSGISPIGNKTNAIFWNFRNSLVTSIVILSTIGYGTVFPKTSGGQMFCIIFAIIGIPQSIILIKHVGKLVSLPCEKFGNYLRYKGIREKNVHLGETLFFTLTGTLLFVVLPPFIFMSSENWTYVEGLYYIFTSITTIGFGDYTIVSNPVKQSRHIIYSIIAIWLLHGITWIALVFNMITNSLQELEAKLNKEASEIEKENKNPGFGKQYI